MATPISVTQIPCFSPSVDISSVSNSWGYLAYEVGHFRSCYRLHSTDDRQKRMLLLHTAGEEVQGIFPTLADTEATYDEAVAMLNICAFFLSKANVTSQRRVFCCDCQKADETVSQFVVQLRKLALHCEFGAQTFALIRSVIRRLRNAHQRHRAHNFWPKGISN